MGCESKADLNMLGMLGRKGSTKDPMIALRCREEDRPRHASGRSGTKTKDR